MFISDIAVAGYQSLYRVGLKLGKFTVIYGESDVGKSALYRAVRALITCESGDSFISHGETKTGVVLRLVSGEKIAYVKRKGKSAEYRCGEKLWRRNRALPVEIAQKLKIAQLNMDNEKFYPNLRGQFDSLFLLFESSAKRARVLGSLISNILLLGIRRANAERNRNEAEVRALESLIEELDRRENFNWVSFTASVKGAAKVLKKTLNGVQVYTELQQLLVSHAVMSQCVEFSVDFLKPNFFSDTEKLLGVSLVLQDRIFGYKSVVADVDKYESYILETDAELKDLKQQIAEVKKKLMVTCPHCKKKISILELKK